MRHCSLIILLPVGHAEQFSSVKSKKQVKKETGSIATPASFQGAAAPALGSTGGVASAPRGGRGGIAGARGGRGGASECDRLRRRLLSKMTDSFTSIAAAARGARGGGRGGLRGASTGRGGAALPVDGKPVEAGTSNAKSAQGGATWADAVAATSSKSNGGAGASWGDDTEGLDLKTAAPTTTAETPSNAKAPVQSTEQTAAATSPTQEEPGKVASVLAKILPSSLVPKGSKMSWAQVARPAEPAKMEVSEPVLIGAYSSPHAAKTSTEPSAHEMQPSTNGGGVAAGSKPEEAVQAEPPAPITSSLAEEPTETSASLPPAPIVAPSAVEPTSASQAATSGKPGMGRSAQSQRAIQRAKQQEAVVMAGNTAQYDNLGVRFGSLNFLGGDDNDAQTEEPAANGAQAAPATNQSGYETSAGQQGYGATNTYADHFSQPKQTAAATAVPSHVQQQTQTTPTHQDAFAQASSSPYNGNKQESANAQQYGYQQGLSQHQQAHQAAVAQAQQAHQQLPQQSSTTTQVDHQYQQSGPEAGGYASSPAAQTSQGQQQQQHQQPNSQYADYYASLDSQRMASFYGSYDQQSALSSRGTEERSAAQQGPGAVASNDVHQQQQPPHHQSHPSAAHASTPQQQQYPANVMPYYYPQYYLPGQFQQQHYGQPGAGYGQYALYGQQPQHPSSKPAAAPAAHQSPYSQNGPADSSAYGNTSGQYGSPAAASLTAAGTGYDGGLGRQNASSNDYSKLYGNMATPTSTHSSSIPGLGGFLGQTPSGPNNGNSAQTKSSAQSNSLENAYRGYDNGKVSPAAQQGQQQSQAPQQAGSQQQRQQQQQPGATPQQQQQYYQQYNAYAAHQPGAASGNYASYPYNRQYWQ
jgi:hypothetical protein